MESNQYIIQNYFEPMSSQKADDMLNEYPDLSDEGEVEPALTQKSTEEKALPNSQPYKMNKPNQGQPPQAQKQVFTAPLLFGGKNFFPPPPPPGSKGKINILPPPPPPVNHSYSKPQILNPQGNFKFNELPQRPERERKNYVYVKNIPKHYNQTQKLMTFFKNEGQVRQIKVNLDDFSATVRFAKEEDSIKFINSNKAIFNRSFITYSLNEKDVVPLELIKERENDESGKIKKPIEVEIKQSRERLDTVLADKIRAILFLLKNIEEENTLVTLRSELEKSIEQKNMLQKYGYEQLETANKMISNEYDWTIAYTFPRNIENQKKSLFFDLQKKFGPVSNLEFTPINLPNEQILNAGSNEPVETTEYIVKLHFLGIKSSWEYYFFKLLSEGASSSQEKDLQVQGSRLKALFNEGIIKKPSIQLTVTSSKEQAKEELLEIGENGEIKVFEQQQPIHELQVDLSQIAKVEEAQKQEGKP